MAIKAPVTRLAVTCYITQERDADYLISLKGNQSGILERAELKLPQEFFSL